MDDELMDRPPCLVAHHWDSVLIMDGLERRVCAECGFLEAAEHSWTTQGSWSNQAIPGVDEEADAAEERRKEIVAEELRQWWLQQAEMEVQRTVPKAIEYGAADLEVMGTAMQHLIPKDRRSRQMGLEMALAFYCLGKCARLFGAFERGEYPSEDTWFDIGVYTRMAERVRQTGSWLPEVPK